MPLYGEAALVGDPDMTRRSVLMISKLYGISGATEKRISYLTEQAGSADGRFFLTLISELADVWTERADAEKNVTKKASYMRTAYKQYMTLKHEGSASAHTLDRLAYISETLGDYDAAADFVSELTRNYPEDYRGFKRKAFLEAAIEEERQESERTYDEFRDAYNRANALFSSSGNLADDEMLKLRELHEKLRKGGWFG
jgi:tetratricopeptide (TPR) repeat protein